MHHHIIELNVSDSTNDSLANMLAEEDLDEGTVVISEFQNRGKGMLQNSWHSEKGKNLLFSILLKPINIHVDQQFFLSKTISLAVHDMLTAFVDPALIQIKWPNDVLINSKKICGILIKCNLRKSKVQNAIIGIGLNVNQSTFPKHFSATSILTETGQNSKIDHLLRNLLKEIDTRFTQFNQKHFEQINSDYNERLLGYNQWMEYIQMGQVFAGKIKHIRGDGRLLLEKRDGTTEYFEVKEISLNLTQPV